MSVRDQLLEAVRRSRFSERRLSMLATGSTDTVRNIRRGAAPRADTLEAVCQVLGLELQLSPGLLSPNEDGVAAARPQTRFTGTRELPVYEWADPSEKGYVRRPYDPNRAPAPENMPDDGLAFYLRMPDYSMAPAGIAQGDYCLVSPCAELAVDQRAWIRGPAGRETIRWVMRLSAAGYDLGAWYLDEVHHHKLTHVRWTEEDVVHRGVVLDVYKTMPTVTKALQPMADWRPDALAELWRAGLFSDELKKVTKELDETVSAVEETEMRIKRLAGTGAISAFHAEQLLRVLVDRLQASLRNMGSSIIGGLAEGSGDTPRR